jgi:hypothetical protein
LGATIYNFQHVLFWNHQEEFYAGLRRPPYNTTGNNVSIQLDLLCMATSDALFVWLILQFSYMGRMERPNLTALNFSCAHAFPAKSMISLPDNTTVDKELHSFSPTDDVSSWSLHILSPWLLCIKKFAMRHYFKTNTIS